eukprot:14615851-Alexandrium_andersonii.AAC.1
MRWSYIVHSECDGNPHCVFVRVSADPDPVAFVRDGRDEWRLLLSELRSCAAQCLDSPTIVTFEVGAVAGAAPCPAEPPLEARNALLELLAGSGRSSDEFSDEQE